MVVEIAAAARRRAVAFRRLALDRPGRAAAPFGPAVVEPEGAYCVAARCRWPLARRPLFVGARVARVEPPGGRPARPLRASLSAAAATTKAHCPPPATAAAAAKMCGGDELPSREGQSVGSIRVSPLVQMEKQTWKVCGCGGPLGALALDGAPLLMSWPPVVSGALPGWFA